MKANGDLLGKVSYLPDIHRLLPQSPDSELGVLSSFLLAPRDVGGLCAEKQIQSAHFHIPAHATIYGVLFDLWNHGTAIDFISLTQILRDRGLLDQVGGAAAVTALFTFLPTAANVGYYLETLQNKFTLREIIRVCTEHAARSYDEQDDVPALLDNLERKALEIRTDRGQSKIVTAKTAVVEAINSLQEAYDRRGSVSGIATGFTQLDKMIDGLHEAEMIILAGLPSHGKTSCAMNIAEHIAVDAEPPLPVAIFSLEMPYRRLMERSICSRAKINMTRIREGFLRPEDFGRLQQAATKIAGARMFIDDSSDLTVQELRGRARRLKQQHDVKLIVVDYLQLLRSSTKRAQDNRQQEVAEVSAGLKAMAKELSIPVLVLAQLSRKFADRGASGSRPRLSDLRESGSIEADADKIGFVVRPELFAENEEERKELEGVAELIIAKNRCGPLGDVPLTFLKEITRFESRARVYDEEPTHGPREQEAELAL
jgi:replicative DNA helicase